MEQNDVIVTLRIRVRPVNLLVLNTPHPEK